MIGPEYQADVLPELRDMEREMYLQEARERDARNAERAPSDPKMETAEGSFEFSNLVAKRKIVDDKTGEKVTQYLVQWKGFKPSEATWQELKPDLKAVKAFERRFKKDLKPVK